MKEHLFAKDNGKAKVAKSKNSGQAKAQEEKAAESGDKASADKKDSAQSDESAPALDLKDEEFGPKEGEESMGWLMFKALIVVGLMAGGFYVFFKFVTQKAGIQTSGSEVIKVLATVPVAQNKFIQVVDIAGKVVVIGVADGGINLITEVTDKNEIDRIRLVGSRRHAAEAGGFQEYMAKYLGKFWGRVQELGSRRSGKSYKSGQVESGVDLTYLKNQKDRLRNLNGHDE